jgi:secondary thiamine-phosphate synthase enzyme
LSFHTISVKSKSATEMLNITSSVQSCVKEDKVQEGICLVYCPHTTAGITINENADPDVKTDMIKEINKIIPFDDAYRHYEGNSAAHIKATFTGLQVMIPIHEGRLTLGTWQGIYFCEYDGPRNRTVQIQIIREWS